MISLKYYDVVKKDIFPLATSITGRGSKKFLKIIKKHFPKLKIYRINSGKQVFDWKIPPEWNIETAYVLDKNNRKIINFKNHNLHIVGYSIPINKTLKKKELLQKLHSLKNQPNAIPYVTSYYNRNWGFCITHNQKKSIIKTYKNSDKFKVVIKSNHNYNGQLCFGEYLIPGKSKSEILISTYICHPSMANNELSGPIVSMGLINYFKIKKLDKTLRFVFIPETIGSISYLSKNLKYLKENVIGGYNLSCIGDERQHSCMFSKYQNSPSDESVIEAYKKLRIKNYKIYPFLKRASDERQYNSPGVDLRISSIFRTKYGEYPEYHTSLDNFSLVTLKGISGGFKVAKKSVELLLKKIFPKYKIICEPQMGKRGLYPTLNDLNENKKTRNYMNFLQYADGYNSLEKISNLIELDLRSVKKINLTLLKFKLINN